MKVKLQVEIDLTLDLVRRAIHARFSNRDWMCNDEAGNLTSYTREIVLDEIISSMRIGGLDSVGFVKSDNATPSEKEYIWYQAEKLFPELK